MATDTQKGATRTLKASEFRAKCLQLMDEVAESGEEIVITKHGKPVAKLTPHQGKRAPFGAHAGKPWFGRDRGKIDILGDIISPIDVEWEADVDPNRVLNP